MTDELVRQLRDDAEFFWRSPYVHDRYSKTLTEAADRIEALESALRGCLALIRRDYYDQRAAALEGHIIAHDARKEWDQGWAALCEQPPEAP